MAIPNNQLQNVQTYQKAELAWMLNEFVAIRTANKKFKDFNNVSANLGDSVSFDLAPRASTKNGLVVSSQPSVQRVQSLICSQAVHSSSAYSDQQFIFNVEDYMDRFGMSRATELGSVVEADILSNIVSGTRVNNPQDPRFGQPVDPTSGPFRFFGDGTTPINSYRQLAQAQANFRDFGAADYDKQAIIPMTNVPAIVDNGLSQFTVNRGNEQAESWQFASVNGFTYAESNLLPTHESGTVGQSATTLTLVSTNDPTGANITQLTFSGASASDLNAFKAGDLCVFNDGVSGVPNIRFRTFIGHKVSQQSVQFRVTADADSNGSGNVTINIYPALSSISGSLDQNLSVALQPGMQIFTLPSHKAGVIMSGSPLYLAMPRLPDLSPFNTVTTTDKDSGCSIRHYWGAQFGQNVRAYVWDLIWGSTLVAQNSMRLAFPLD